MRAGLQPELHRRRGQRTLHLHHVSRGVSFAQLSHALGGVGSVEHLTGQLSAGGINIVPAGFANSGDKTRL